MCFHEIEVIAGKQTFYKYAVTVKFVAVSVYYVGMSIILTVRCTVTDIGNASRFFSKIDSHCRRGVAVNFR